VGKSGTFQPQDWRFKAGEGFMKVYGFIRIAALLLALSCPTSALAQSAPSNWPKALTLGTASPGGVYYVYGEGVAKILTEKLGVPVNTLPTQGPVHNVKLVEFGGVQLGMMTMGVGLQGWKGIGEWTGGKQHRSMRALFPMYDTTFQFVALRSSGITTIAQLDKRNVGVGPRAGTGGTYVPAILNAVGVSATIGNGSFADAAKDLIGGRYDALAMAAGVPFPALKQAEAKEPLNFISLTLQENEAVRKALPELSESEIPAGTYSSLTAKYSTLGVYNFAIGRADLPDDLVYLLVKAIHENQPQLAKAHAAAKETLAQNVVKNTFLPFHPGAARYYREKGLKIPDALVATN
jgi:TRAP transporter TAXI family solute receptor